MTEKILKTIMVVIGLGLIIWKTSILVAVGIFFLMWANNFDYIKHKKL